MIDKQRRRKVMIDKQKAVGGSGGYLFDSGCNLSGVRKIRIQCGRYSKHNDVYRNTIKRVFLEFKKPSPANNLRFPSYDGPFKPDKFRERILETEPDDPIIRVDIWTDGKVVNAIQFHMRSGFISEVYGLPQSDSESYSFAATQPDSYLVGIHGSFGEVIDKLGFTFAKIESHSTGFPPSPSDTFAEAVIVGEK
eukprot:CAMPEP_0197192366 /NCGR_PEP_ID=MMETSP1423-20130617/24963_1 /TAXON_ID=476441 /ORGANISM="Pseudo-nitzschia heimii, Strain UNC1101" /LENGTH=193 /DNA_ID=CAMNT_0042645233 /DNA_START=104 /DNA_END=685 /DNA_ORIENTATION=+